MPGHQGAEEDGERLGGRGVEEEEGDQEKVAPVESSAAAGEACVRGCVACRLHSKESHTHRHMCVCSSSYLVNNGSMRAAAALSHAAPARAFTSSSKGSMLCCGCGWVRMRNRADTPVVFPSVYAPSARSSTRLPAQRPGRRRQRAPDSKCPFPGWARRRRRTHRRPRFHSQSRCVVLKIGTAPGLDRQGGRGRGRRVSVWGVFMGSDRSMRAASDPNP